MLFKLADRLRCQIADIEAMPVTEFQEWLAYFKIMKDAE